MHERRRPAAARERIRVASDIAAVQRGDPVPGYAARVLSDALDERFTFGLGVCHPMQVNPCRHTYDRPLAGMRADLDAIDDDPFVGPDGESARRPSVRRVIAAVRLPMLRRRAPRLDLHGAPRS